MFTVIKITNHPVAAVMDTEEGATMDLAVTLAAAILQREGLDVGQNDYEVRIFTDEHIARLWHEDQPEEDNVSYFHCEETL